jgi:WD40 repeat protein
VWDLASGRELRTLAGHSDAVNAVAVTVDGQRAVSASNDETLKVWELSSGRELRVLTGHGNQVTAVAVTADGQRAVSASRDLKPSQTYLKFADQPHAAMRRVG